MKVTIIHHREEYIPVCSILDRAIHQVSFQPDEMIKIVVSDARAMVKDDSYRYRANKVMYRYSSVLCKYNRGLLQKMNPDMLTIKDYISLLEFFESL